MNCFRLILSGFLLLLLVNTAWADRPDAVQFQTDTGLPLAAVELLESGAGISHYRMRTWTFRADATQLEKSLGRLGMHAFERDNEFDQGIRSLVGVVADAGQGHMGPLMQMGILIMVGADAFHRTPLGAALVKGFFAVTEFGLDNWLKLLPAAQRILVACYPSGAGFAFRFALIVENGTDGRTSVSFAAGGAVPSGASHTACKEIRSTFYQPWRGQLLPFAFAERSFDEMISATLPSGDLRYHGTFFVDSSHFFRFALAQPDFLELVRSKSMKPLAPDFAQWGVGEDAERLQLHWWPDKKRASELQWFGFCQRFGNDASYINAAWHEGVVYWLSSGTSGPQGQVEACGNPYD